MLERDCLAVTQALRSGVVGSSEFYLVIDDIIALSASFSSIVWSFVKRSGNKVAHYLTDFQPIDLGWRSCEDDVPDSVLNIACSDFIE